MQKAPAVPALSKWLGGYDDAANACAGALWLLRESRQVWIISDDIYSSLPSRQGARTGSIRLRTSAYFAYASILLDYLGREIRGF